VAYNFRTRKNKIKLLTEYESVTQKVLISLESILYNAKQRQHVPPFMARKMFKRYSLCRHGSEGGYEQPSKQSFVVHLTANKLV
jgi:hypothetical protein